MNKDFVLVEEKENIKLNKDKKYVFYYRGCFCPPHVGHFRVLKNIAKNNKYGNIKIIVDQIGSVKRHGVDKSINIKIMRLYIRYINVPISIVHYDSSSDMSNHPFLRDCDCVFKVRGLEEMSDIPKCVNNANELKYSLRKRGIRLYCYIIKRPNLNTISATEFVKAIENNDPDVFRFLPSISQSDKYKVIKYISSCLNK